MRNLSVRQKKALDKIFNENPNILSVEDLDADEFNRIEEMNPHETFFQNANRYLYDLVVEKYRA